MKHLGVHFPKFIWEYFTILMSMLMFYKWVKITVTIKITTTTIMFATCRSCILAANAQHMYADTRF